MALHLMDDFIKLISEYDQEIPQSQTANQLTAPHLRVFYVNSLSDVLNLLQNGHFFIFKLFWWPLLLA